MNNVLEEEEEHRRVVAVAMTMMIMKKRKWSNIGNCGGHYALPEYKSNNESGAAMLDL